MSPSVLGLKCKPCRAGLQGRLRGSRGGIPCVIAREVLQSFRVARQAPRDAGRADATWRQRGPRAADRAGLRPGRGPVPARWRSGPGALPASAAIRRGDGSACDAGGARSSDRHAAPSSSPGPRSAPFTGAPLPAPGFRAKDRASRYRWREARLGTGPEVLRPNAQCVPPPPARPGSGPARGARSICLPFGGLHFRCCVR